MPEKVFCTLCGREGDHYPKDCPLRPVPEASYNGLSTNNKGNEREDQDQED